MTSFSSFDYYDIEMLGVASDDFAAYIARFADSELDLEQKIVKASGLRILARAETALGDARLLSSTFDYLAKHMWKQLWNRRKTLI